MIELTDKEFFQFQRFIFDAAGISLSAAKKTLVQGRLAKRLQARRLASYSEYFRLLEDGAEPAEAQCAVDLLTTNETYFFREQKHFDMLRQIATEARRHTQPFRVWSAACSSGEEAYSAAMVLADALGDRAWDVVGTDISTRVLKSAMAGHYPDTRTRHIRPDYRQRFCLIGIGPQAGTLLIDPDLRARAQFMQANLNATLPQTGMFDVVFLRNVMIYFNEQTKRRVVDNVLTRLKPGGYFFVGHSETLSGLSDKVEQVAVAIYRKL